MNRRRDMYMTTLDETRHQVWERAHTTFRPTTQMSWIKHPLASTAGTVSKSAHNEPWIFRLLRSPFVWFGGTASAIAANESERARRLH